MTGINNSDAATGGMATLTTGRPTIAGHLPPALAGQFQQVNMPALPEFSRLPSPKERDPYTGASRTWLVEHDKHGHFLVRVRQRGKMRGTVFVNLPKLQVHQSVTAFGGDTSGADPLPGTDPAAGKGGQMVSEAAAELEKSRPVKATPRVGRNDACPCGSGKKYKSCCGQ